MSFQRPDIDKNYEAEQGKRAAITKKKSQICIWIDAEQYKQLKIIGVVEGKSITEMISKSINLYLKSEAK